MLGVIEVAPIVTLMLHAGDEASTFAAFVFLAFVP